MKHETWNQRYRRFLELCKSDRAEDWVEIKVELEKLKTEKELSFGERNLLDHVNAKLNGTCQSNVIQLFGGAQ